LLDTSILIDPPTAEELSQHADELAVSVITIAELQYGITAIADPLEHIRRRQRIHAVLDQFDVLPFDVPTADYYGAWPHSFDNTAATPDRAAWTYRSPRPPHDTNSHC
jgi:predicted nucleic acid-binding protein